MAVAAVIFDFFGTLTPSTPTSVWDDHAARSAAPLSIPARAWRAVLDASFPERATGSLGDFKFGPMLGEWLADLATGRDADPAAGRFSLGRFRAAGAH
jgi:hypothetical protein